MNDIKSTIELVVLVATGLISVYGALASIRNRKNEVKAVEAKTGLDEKQQSKLAQDIAIDVESNYRERIGDFRKDVALLRGELEATRRELDVTRKNSKLVQKELEEIRWNAILWERFFFEEHLPWDYDALKLLNSNNIQHRSPPSWRDYLERNRRNG